MSRDRIIKHTLNLGESTSGGTGIKRATLLAVQELLNCDLTYTFVLSARLYFPLNNNIHTYLNEVLNTAVVVSVHNSLYPKDWFLFIWLVSRVEELVVLS